MKAIFVLDEMPSNCDECPLFNSYYSDMTCRANGNGINYPYPKDKRQDWCPLRPAPEKRHTLDNFWEMCANIVRNACIDEILGEERR